MLLNNTHKTCVEEDHLIYNNETCVEEDEQVTIFYLYYSRACGPVLTSYIMDQEVFFLYLFSCVTVRQVALLYLYYSRVCGPVLTLNLFVKVGPHALLNQKNEVLRIWP
jgi:hypothetical protein